MPNYRCDQCGQPFETLDGLDIHQATECTATPIHEGQPVLCTGTTDPIRCDDPDCPKHRGAYLQSLNRRRS